MYWLNFEKRFTHVSKYMCIRDRTVWSSANDSDSYQEIYGNFSNETFRVYLRNNLSNEVFVNNDDGLQKLCKTTMDTLNSFARGKYVRGNQMLFMTKSLSKEIMTKSRLRNKY